MSEQTETEKSPFNWTKVFLISLFLGVFGIDRFYVGQKGLGVFKLLTFGGIGIWWLIDLLIIASGKFTDASKKEIRNTTKQRVLTLVFLVPLATYLVVAGFYDTTERNKRELATIEQNRQANQSALEAVNASKKSKEQEYEQKYGKVTLAEGLYKLFKQNSLKANNICKNSPVQIEGQIVEIGENSVGKYIDFYTHKEHSNQVNVLNRKKLGDIRVFLEECKWNNDIILSGKVKTDNHITIGGICYGETEAFGIKSKIIIGNARILKKFKEFL